MNQPAYYLPDTVDREGQVLTCDLCIYGATSAGIIAAVEASRRGLKATLLATGDHLGGLTTGGLGFTDFGDKQIVGGLSHEFYRRVGQYYGLKEEWKFEPSVALKVFKEMLREASIEPICRQYIDSVESNAGRILSIRMESGLVVQATFYMDATYEGDMMARAGVPYTVGRESNSQYGELLNGVQIREHHQFTSPVSPWCKEDDSSSGLLPGITPEPLATQGSGDHKIQAYNFRMCLTRNPSRISFPKPYDYDPINYELLARFLRTGWRETFLKFDPVRGGKTDTNNHGAVSTDYIGANHEYPNATYRQREKIFQEHVNYLQGLFWFYCYDERVPASIRKEMLMWGLAEDEFYGSSHWPPQLYIREARRMVSDEVITELNCRGYQSTSESIGCGAYGMDSHNCQRIVVNGRILNEGDVQCSVDAYPIPYSSVIPPRGSINNLFVPVCISASHIAYGSCRMEPVFMILAQSCAIAIALCLRKGIPAQKLDYSQLKPELELAKQVLSPTKTDTLPFPESDLNIF